MSYERMIGNVHASGTSKVANIDVQFVIKMNSNANLQWKVTDLMFQEGNVYLEYDENVIEMNRNMNNNSG